MKGRKRTIKLWTLMALVALTAGLLVMSSAPAALAGPGHGHGFMKMLLGDDARPLVKRFLMDRMGSGMDLKEELNISQEQWAELKKIMDKHRPVLLPMVSDLITAKRALHDAVTADTPSEAAIRAASEQMSQVIGTIGVEASVMVGEARQVLTAEQQEILKKHHGSREKAVDELLEGLKNLK